MKNPVTKGLAASVFAVGILSCDTFTDGSSCNQAPDSEWQVSVISTNVIGPSSCPVMIPSANQHVVVFTAEAKVDRDRADFFIPNTAIGIAWNQSSAIFCHSPCIGPNFFLNIFANWENDPDHFQRARTTLQQAYASGRTNLGVPRPQIGQDEVDARLELWNGMIHLFKTPAFNTFGLTFTENFDGSVTSPTHATQFTNVTAVGNVPSSGQGIAGNYTTPLSYAWKFNNVTQSSCAGSLTCTKQIGSNGSYNTWKLTVTDGDGTQVTKQATTIANTGGGCGDCVLRADPDAPSDSTVTTKISN